MQIEVSKTKLKKIQHFRDLFLAESSFQFVYDKCHIHGWADTYLFTADENPIGYGSVWGKDKREDRDSIFEFYVLPPFRKLGNLIFQEFKAASGTPFVECQTNDVFLTSMLYESGKNIYAEKILFKDSFQTFFEIPGVVFQKKNKEKGLEYQLEQNGAIIATGGYVTNYNFPFIDMYYEVNPAHRRKGVGALFVQELKKEAYRLNRVPSARCDVGNLASKATLLKAGMDVCGHILIGEL